MFCLCCWPLISLDASFAHVHSGAKARFVSQLNTRCCFPSPSRPQQSFDAWSWKWWTQNNSWPLSDLQGGEVNLLFRPGFCRTLVKSFYLLHRSPNPDYVADMASSQKTVKTLKPHYWLYTLQPAGIVLLHLMAVKEQLRLPTKNMPGNFLIWWKTQHSVCVCVCVCVAEVRARVCYLGVSLRWLSDVSPISFCASPDMCLYSPSAPLQAEGVTLELVLPSFWDHHSVCLLAPDCQRKHSENVLGYGERQCSGRGVERKSEMKNIK